MPRPLAAGAGGDLVAEPDTAFSLGEREEILWRGAAVARLRATGDRLAPRIELLADPMLDSGTAGRARQRLRPGCRRGSASGWQPWRR